MAGKRFDSDEQNTIKRTIEEQRMFGMSNKETLQLIEKRIGRSISEEQYIRYKNNILDDNEVRNWYFTFSRIGFLDHYKQRIDEVLYVLEKLMRKFAWETSKPIEQQSVHILGSLSRNIRETEALLIALGLGSPILMQVKNLIDKGVSVEGIDINEFTEHNERSNITDTESRKTYPEDRNRSPITDDSNRIA